jgi:hypothetical protein
MPIFKVKWVNSSKTWSNNSGKLGVFASRIGLSDRLLGLIIKFE